VVSGENSHCVSQQNLSLSFEWVPNQTNGKRPKINYGNKLNKSTYRNGKLHDKRVTEL